MPINVKEIPLCAPTQPHIRTEEEYQQEKINRDKKLPPSTYKFMFNSGTSMFFAFIKMAIMYLLLRTLVSDGFNAVTNYLEPCT